MRHLLAAVMLALTATAAVSQDHSGHATWHHVYKNWMTQSGTSCCNDQDCAPGRTRVSQSGVEVEIAGDWVRVPPERVRPYRSPDLNDHVCRIGRHILCVVLGGGV